MGLTEIKNEEFLTLLKNEFHSNSRDYKSMAPIICGTIVNKAQNSRQFDRKLKMIKAPLFTLL